MVIHKNKGMDKKKDVQKKKNIFLYSWLESEAGRGSNEICSAVVHFLKSVKTHCKQKGYNQLHLYCDSCPGQNKNSTTMGLLLRYVTSGACPFKRVLVTFPIVGHSYLPADRVFGRIEKVLRKPSEILLPAGYHAILRAHRTLNLYGTDWSVYNHKAVADPTLCTAGIGVRECRRWLFRRGSSKVQTSDTFAGPWDDWYLLADGISLAARKPLFVPATTHVSATKKPDVLKLLQLVRGSPEEKGIYDTILLRTMSKKVKDDLVLARPTQHVKPTQKPARKKRNAANPATTAPPQPTQKPAHKTRNAANPATTAPPHPAQKPACRKRQADTPAHTAHPKT